MSIHHDRYDAIVVGARAAPGAATTMLLARAGKHVAASSIAAGTAPTRCRRTRLQSGAGVLQLHRWGVLDRIGRGGDPGRSGGRRSRTPTSSWSFRSSRANGIDALYAGHAGPCSTPWLVDAALEAGVDVRFGVTVTGLQRDHDGTVIGVAGSR